MVQIDLQELSKYFKMPEKQVAKELGICLTSLKKIARSHGISRWPYRKVKSLDRKLRKLDVMSGGARAGGEGGDLEGDIWSCSSGSSHSSSGTQTPSSSEASIATTPRVAVKSEGSWTPGRTSPAAAPQAKAAEAPAHPPPAHAPAADPTNQAESEAGGAAAALPGGAPAATVCDAAAAAGHGEAGCELAACDQEMEDACSSVTSHDHTEGVPPAASAEDFQLRGASPEPVPLTDEEIVAMLADCAGQRHSPSRGASPRPSSHKYPQPDPQQLWQELPMRGLSDVEIMSGLAQCAAEREEGGGPSFLGMEEEADACHHHDGHQDVGLALGDFGHGDFGVADFLAVA